MEVKVHRWADDLQFYILFNSILVILQCITMTGHLQLKRFPPPATTELLGWKFSVCNGEVWSSYATFAIFFLSNENPIWRLIVNGCMRIYALSKFKYSWLSLSRNRKGLSKTLRDIRTSTYQICSIEEKTIWTTKFYKWLCNLTSLIRNIYWKYCGKGEKLLPRSKFSSFLQYFVTWF